MACGTYGYIKGPGAVSEQQEERLYNVGAPAAMIIMTLGMFFSVLGSIFALNKKAQDAGVKTNVPGYEGQSVAHEQITNPGERAFFGGFALILQAFIGFMICLCLRKQQEVQISNSMIMKMTCRGAIAGTLATLFVEFVRLPFHDYMQSEELVVGRVFIVLLWVGVVAIMEEAIKLGAVAVGLKRSEDDTEATSAEWFTNNPRALAICGLAAGIGFAFVENIPRMYAASLERPLVEVSQSYGGSATEKYLIDEPTLRASRVWIFIFWGVLNLQPWLTGIAAIQYAKIVGKGPLAPTDWFNVLKMVVLIHFFFDLLDRSAHPFVEILGCCAIPYAMYAFKKQWESLDGGLLEDQS